MVGCGDEVEKLGIGTLQKLFFARTFSIPKFNINKYLK